MAVVVRGLGVCGYVCLWLWLAALGGAGLRGSVPLSEWGDGFAWTSVSVCVCPGLFVDWWFLLLIRGQHRWVVLYWP